MGDPIWTGQHGFDVRLRWGRRGALAAAAEKDVLIVVDVLSFSSAVAYAVAAGATVRPCAWDEDRVAVTAREGAIGAVSREEAQNQPDGFSLSPVSMRNAPRGARIVLASPNGATCCAAAPSVPALIVAGLVNADAAARHAGAGGTTITVLACGERWQDDTLRVSLEDYLGAGAVIAKLPGTRSPEAAVCEAAFWSQRNRLEDVMAECASGRELRERGFAEDVALASAWNALAVVPVMRDGWLGAV